MKDESRSIYEDKYAELDYIAENLEDSSADDDDDDDDVDDDDDDI